MLDLSTMKLRILSMGAAPLVLGLFLASCGGGGETTQAPVTADTLKTVDDGNGLVNVGGELFSIPSPAQTALLIRKLGLPYDKALPMGTDSLARFATKEKQALAMGVLGADLAYTTIHKDGQRSIELLKSIESLASTLNLKNAFDAGMVEDFRKNVGNEDSLLLFSGKAFRAADQYLKNDQRNDVSAAVLAGGWVESLYLTLGASTGKLDERVGQRVAEQQHSLQNLITLLESTKASPALVDSLKGLSEAYAGVKSTYSFAQPTVDAGNKTTYINSITKVEIPAETLEAITRKIKSLRAAIIA
jgi:hypothetical protein